MVEADGELVCGSCGIVAGYKSADEPITAPTSKMIDFDYGLTTIIGRQSVDHAGRKISITETVKRMRKCDTWTQTYNRTMPVAMAQLAKLRDNLGMTDACHEYAAYLFRKAVAASFLVGRRVTHCTAAAALLACRKHGINRTVHDIMRVTGLAKRDICRTYRQLYEMFDPDLPVPDPVS